MARCDLSSCGDEKTTCCNGVFGRLAKRDISFGLTVKRSLYGKNRVMDQDQGASTERIPRLVRRPALLKRNKEKRRLDASIHINGEG